MSYPEDEIDDVSEEIDAQVDVQGTEQNEQQVQNTKQQNLNLAKEKAEKIAEQQIRNQKILQKMGSTKGMSVVSSVLKIIGPYIWPILLVIAAIIIIIGLIMFILTLPGALMAKLNAILQSFGEKIAAFFSGSEEAQVKMQDVIDVADYLESMGYDLYQYGFLTDKVLTPYSKDFFDELKSKFNNNNDSDKENDVGYKKYSNMKTNAYIDEYGIGRTSDGITNIESDILKTYLISDNYVYTCKNFNKNVKKAFSSVSTFFSGLFDNQKWGSGLLGLYEERDSLLSIGKIGEDGKAYRNGLFSRYKIEIDGTSKTLKITTKASKNITGGNNSILSKLFRNLGLSQKVSGNVGTFSYNLDGWTARYGIPLEFLLAVHLTSMSPDLALDLARSFDTEVVILLHKVEFTVKGGFRKRAMMLAGKTDCVTYEQLTQYKEQGGYGAVLAYTPDNFVNSGFDDNNCSSNCKKKAVKEAEDSEVQAGTKEFSEVCDNCKTFIDNTISDLKVLALGQNDTYYPYISKVTDHWFRDVYFVAPLYTKVVSNDYDYEELTKERWTDYENTVDDEGNITYTLYKLDNLGNLTNEVYNGTKEDADREGIKVAKKAITKNITEEAEGNYVTNPGYWSAYSLDVPPTEWMPLKEFIELLQAALNAAGIEVDLESICENTLHSDLEDLWMCVDLSQIPTQIQDAQRTETNATIKRIFSTNKYYQYDGTKERADKIAKDRAKTTRLFDNTAFDQRDQSLIGNFSVTRDSLTAFNILTNMNTFDSDSIYRDFKELIVELNYFDKEDLTQGPTNIGEWLLPDTGSAGWPVKRYEKGTDYYGTLIHSTVDLVNLKEKDQALTPIISDTGDGDTPTAPDLNLDIFGKSDMIQLAEENNKKLPEKNDQDNVINLDLISPIAGLEALYAADGTGSGSGLQRGTFLETAQAVWEYIVNKGDYVYRYPGKPAPYQDSNRIDCSSYVAWVLYEYGYDEFGSTTVSTSTFTDTDWNAKYGWEEIVIGNDEDCRSKLQAGDILVRVSESGDVHHMQIIKEIAPNGDIITYDCGKATHWESQYINGFRWNGFASGADAPDAPGKIIRIEDAAKQFTGFDGYENVVSPITGEIIEAGTTKIKNIETGNISTEEGEATDDEEGEEVGFIKIRAINKADVEAYIDADNDDYRGYKYFYEAYNTAGITDYILYIEGFDVRIVDENLNFTNDSALMGEVTDENGHKSSTGEIVNYYTREVYDSTISKDTRERLEKRQDVMEQAKPYIQTSDGKIFVKAGTVLGKTYTDEGTPTSVSRDNGAHQFPDDAKPRPGIANMKKKTDTTDDGKEYNLPNGNYIRLILRTSEDGASGAANKDTILENVEDYLEVETGVTGSDTSEDESSEDEENTEESDSSDEEA